MLRLENVDMVRLRFYKLIILERVSPSLKKDPPPIWSISKILKPNFVNFYGVMFVNNNYKLSSVRLGFLKLTLILRREV